MDLTTGMPPPPPPPLAPTSHSEAWLAAIADGETTTRGPGGGGGGGGHDASSDAIDRLLRLRDALQGIGREGWDEPPAFPPPPPAWEQQSQQQQLQQQPSGNFYVDRGTGNGLDPYAFQSPRAWGHHDDAPLAGPTPVAPPSNNRNAYAAFEEDDSDDEAPEGERGRSGDALNNGNGPGRRDEIKKGDGAANMSVRRILLRAHCSLAEAHSRRALDCVSDRRWTAGADECEAAFVAARRGQEILDEEHALLAQVVELLQVPDVRDHADVERVQLDVAERQGGVDEDSGAASVMLSHFVRSRDRYLHAARERIAFLEDKLCRDQEARQEVRSRMGSRWRSNPSPSNTYAERRKAMEAELDEALAGVNRTTGMNVDGMGGR